MTSTDGVSHGSWTATPSTLLGSTGPAHPGEAVVHGAVGIAGAPRLRAELDGRIAVGAQVLVVDVERVKILDSAVLTVLADAAEHLHDERSGSLVLRNASAPLLQQLRLMRLDHMFELEI